MQTGLEILQSIGVFVLGVVTRFGLFLAMVAVVVVPALVIALAIRAREGRRERALGIQDVDGVPFRPDLFYAPGHLWLHRRGSGRGLELGLDGIAQRLMPSVTAVDVARPGTRVARGDTVEDIAGSLVISPNTVRTHIRNARLKLGAGSRAHAIALALSTGLLAPPF